MMSQKWHRSLALRGQGNDNPARSSYSSTRYPGYSPRAGCEASRLGREGSARKPVLASSGRVQLKPTQLNYRATLT